MAILAPLLASVVAVVSLVFLAWLTSPAAGAAIKEWLSGINRYEHLSEELLARAECSQLTPRVVASVREGFSQSDQSEVLELLSKYGAGATPAGRERVHLAILKLSGGQKESVRANVRRALLDHRDVLYSAGIERETL